MRAMPLAGITAVRRLCTAARRYPHTVQLQTRWNDNDAFGHVNNVFYYAFMDDAVNAHLIASGVQQTRFVAESSCRYLAPLQYPQPVEVGMGVTRLGRSSVSYAIGIYSHPANAIAGGPTSGGRELCATGTFVHVYVDGAGRPTPMAECTRAALEAIRMDDGSDA